MNKTAEEIKKEIVDRIISQANGSWKDLTEEGYDEGFKQGLAAAPPPASEGEMAEFLKVVTSERDEFCTFINSLLWDSGLRTRCESLLIIYDQMKERLATLPTREPDGWISVKDRLPDLIEGENYSENVWTICDGERMVMCLCYNPSEDENERGYFWANCNGEIDGDAEHDDNYYPTHWQSFPPLPAPPTNSKQLKNKS